VTLRGRRRIQTEMRIDNHNLTIPPWKVATKSWLELQP
jgi:hypothetical protein